MKNGTRMNSSPILLDTHYWIWLQTGAREQFTVTLLKTIENAAAQGRLLLSVISVWELGMLETKAAFGCKCLANVGSKKLLPCLGSVSLR